MSCLRSTQLAAVEPRSSKHGILRGIYVGDLLNHASARAMSLRSRTGSTDSSMLTLTMCSLLRTTEPAPCTGALSSSQAMTQFEPPHCHSLSAIYHITSHGQGRAKPIDVHWPHMLRGPWVYIAPRYANRRRGTRQRVHGQSYRGRQVFAGMGSTDEADAFIPFPQ